MKRIFFLALYILLLIGWSLRSYIQPEMPYTHDGENHLARFANYEISIREKQFPPRFAPNLVNHFGYPVFNFNYPLANILSLPFSFLSIHYETTFKLIVLLSLVSGSLGIYRWTQTLTDRKTLHFVSIMLYMASPYLLNTVIYRGTIGEIMAYGLLPWILFSLQQYTHKNYLRSSTFFVNIALWMLFFLSHNVTVMFSIPIILIYSVFMYKKSTLGYINLATHILIGVFLTLWFWLPALIEKNQTVLDSAGNNQTLSDHFPTLTQLLFSPIEFGFSSLGSIDTFSFSVGSIQIVTILLAIFLVVHLRKKIINSNYSIFLPSLLISILLIFFQLRLSEPLWNIFSFSRFAQFPWRLSLFLSITVIPLFVIIMQSSKKWFLYLIYFLLSIQFISLWQQTPIDFFHKNKEDYIMFSQTTTTQNENMPKTFTFTDTHTWAPTPTILSGNGTSAIKYWSGSRRVYELTLSEKSTIVEPTMNFVGWQSRANSTLLDYINNEDIKGRIAYTLDAGTYTIETKFTEYTPARIIGDSTSIVTICAIVIYSIWCYKSRRR